MATSNNGEGFIVEGRAQALANYPHMRAHNGLLYVSGISSRRFDNTYEGVIENSDGTLTLDIAAQTKAVIENICTILKQAGADSSHIIDLTIYLTDMSNYGPFNKVYNEYFNAETGPSRTCVGVRELPSPKLLIEIKAVAKDPRA